MNVRTLLNPSNVTLQNLQFGVVLKSIKSCTCISPYRIVCQCSPILACPKRGIETYLLCEKSYGGCENTLFPSRTNTFGIANRRQKTLSILSSSLSNNFDKPTIVHYIAQTKSIRMNDEVDD